jgi:hypothetical protein
MPNSTALIDRAITKYADLVAPIGLGVVRADAIDLLSGRSDAAFVHRVVMSKAARGGCDPGWIVKAGRCARKNSPPPKVTVLRHGPTGKPAAEAQAAPTAKPAAVVDRAESPDIMLLKKRTDKMGKTGACGKRWLGIRSKAKKCERVKPKEEASPVRPAKKVSPHDAIPTTDQAKFFDRFATDSISGKAILDGLKSFSGDDLYTDIRAYESGKSYDKSRKADIERHSQSIGHYIDSGPKFDGEIHRGLSFETKSELNKFIKSIAGGIELDAVSSWSSSPSTAKDFACCDFGAILKVANKSGVSIRNVSEYPEENEVITKKGAKYRIKSQSKIGDNVHIELEEIDP